MTLEELTLTSISGIIAATLFIVEILKRLLKGVIFFQKIPVFIYAILVSVGLVFVANRLILLENGSPMLPGNLGRLMWTAAVAAAGASGFYSWLRSGDTTIQKASVLGKILLIPLILCAGCATPPEHKIYRESSHAYIDSAFHYLLEWAPYMVKTEEHPDGQKNQLPTLTSGDLEQIQKTYSEYLELYNLDRSNDQSGFVFPFIGSNK